MLEGELNVFDFNNTIAGTYFQVVIDKTSLDWGYAFYRMFLEGTAGGFTLDPSDAAYQYLAAGEQTTVTVNYAISDGVATTPASVSWTVTGVNDAPALAGDLHATVIEGGSYLLMPDDLDFTDPDDLATDVTFTVNNLVNGAVLVNGEASASFTGQQLLDGSVSFEHDGSERRWLPPSTFRWRTATRTTQRQWRRPSTSRSRW